MKRSDDRVALLPTLTHARIRLAQGDVQEARRILDEILAERPHDPQARAVLDQLRTKVSRPRAEEPREEPLASPVAGDPASLADRFRDIGTDHPAPVVRLADYLARIRRAKERERS